MIAVSPFAARQLAAMGADPRRIVTVLNAVSIAPPVLGPAPALPARTREQFVSLVACASLRPYKGVHLAIEALRELPPNHLLWVTGDVEDPIATEYVGTLESLAARTGVSDRVAFLGRRGDVHRVMAAADAVLVPSTCEESFSLVTVEAQVVGVPVIGSARGAIPEVLDGGALGLLFDPGAPGALAAAIRRLAGDPDLRARIASSAGHAATRYSYERWSREVASTLAEVVGRAADSRARAA
jgi:glycosyltransferase involved in cell wall biosynthesis